MNRMQYEDALVAARPAMMRRAKKWAGTDAEDLVGQAYIKLLSDEGWQRIGKPGNWALGVVDGMGRNWRRQDQGERKRQTDIENQIESLRAEGGDIVDRMIEEEEIAEKISQIMGAMQGAGLTSREDYIVLARMRGREYDEIAELLGIGRESAVTYYSNAICKIRRKIRGENNLETRL